MSQAPSDAVAAAAETLRNTLVLARALALAGRQVDLSGLDQEVALLCAAALTLPASGQETARQALIALRLAVEALLAALPPDDERGRASPPGPSRRTSG